MGVLGILTVVGSIADTLFLNLGSFVGTLASGSLEGVGGSGPSTAARHLSYKTGLGSHTFTRTVGPLKKVRNE